MTKTFPYNSQKCTTTSWLSGCIQGQSFYSKNTNVYQWIQLRKYVIAFQFENFTSKKFTPPTKETPQIYLQNKK